MKFTWTLPAFFSLVFAPQIFAQQTLPPARQLAASQTNFQHSPLIGSEDCDIAQVLTDDCPIHVENLAGPGNNDLFNSCFQSAEHQSHWFTFTFSAPGTFEFMCTANGFDADMDFALWKGDCPINGGEMVACNWVGPISSVQFLPTGIASDPFSTFGVPPNNEFEQTVFVEAGVPYYLLIDNITSNFVGFNLEFSGTAVMSGSTSPMANVGSPGSSCAQTTTFGCDCSLAGIPGETGPFNVTDMPPTFCGSIENEVWYALEMCWCFVNLRIETGSLGQGVEAQVFADCGPGFAPKTDCITVGPNSVGYFNGISCTPGQVYYLMIDGVNGSMSDFEIVVEPTTGVPPVILLDTIFGPTQVCEGDTILYVAPPVTGAAHCNFTFSDPGTQVFNTGHSSVMVVFGSESGDLCFIATNCEGADTVCLFVQVGSLSFTLTDTIFACLDSLPLAFDDILIDGFGLFAFDTLLSQNGCDSLLQILVLPGPDCPCTGSPVPPADNCADAPPFCESYLNGYCAQNSTATPDAPGNLAALLTCPIDNNQWLSFTACEPTVTLDLAVGNCLENAGLEFSILQTADCQLFAAFENCFEVANDSAATLTANGLTPGQTYLLMADGAGGDICQWQVTGTTGVSNGPTFQEDNTPGQVTGPDAVCAGSTVSFDFIPPICNLTLVGGCPAADQQTCSPLNEPCTFAEDTTWHIEPAGILEFVNQDSSGAPVQVFVPADIFIPPGQQFVEFEIFANIGSSPTDTSQCCPAGCATIIPDGPCEILPLKIKVCKPDVFQEVFFVCPGDCVDFMGEAFCSPGISQITVPDVCGCEDVYEVLIIWDDLSPPFVSQPTIDCSPDGSSYTVSFDILPGGPFSGILVNGQPAGNSFTSAPIPSGGAYNFEILVLGNCGASPAVNISGTFECACVPQTFDLGTIALCPGDCYDLAGNEFCDPGPYTEVIPNPMTGCDDTYIFEIAEQQDEALLNGPITEFCNAANTHYTVTFNLTGGTAPFYVNGGPISGNTYQSDPILSGDPYAFQVTDSGVCEAQELNLQGQYECACVTDPGSVDNSLLASCEAEMVAAAWNNDATLDANDLLVFVLHTDSGTSLGTILGMNTTGVFGFQPGLMAFGQTYYISPVAGEDAGGTVDFADACFTVSPGQPIVFYENPDLDILPPGTLTCAVNAVPLDVFPLGGSGQFSFQWGGPGVSGSGPSVLATLPGDYTCILTDDLSGCTDVATVTVPSDGNLPQFQIQPTSAELTCNLTTVAITASTAQPGLSFEWQLPNGGSLAGPVFTTMAPGVFTVIATGQNGCTATAASNVGQNILPPANVVATGGTLTCDGPTATLFASSSTMSTLFSWAFPTGDVMVGPEITTNIAGSYTLTAIAPNGCTAQASSTVSEDVLPPANVQATGGTLTCSQPFATLTASSSTPGAGFTWVFPSGNESSGASVVTDIAGVYFLTATGSNGCTAAVATGVTADILPPANVQATGGELTCGQPVATLTATSSTPGVVFAWLFPNGSTATGATISTNLPGPYAVTATGQNGCTATAQSTLLDTTEPPENLTATDGELTCDEPSASLQASSSTPGTTFIWLLPNGVEVPGPALSTDLPGTYTVVATAPNGCTAEVSAEVVENAQPPVVSLTGGALNCEQPSVTLLATADLPGTVFTWTLPGGSTQVSASLNTSLPGFYTVFALAQNGCTATGQTLVTQVPDPEIAAVFTADPPTCHGDEDGAIVVETLAGGTAPYALFINDEPITPGTSLDNLPAGQYTLSIVDASGCTASQTIELPEPVEVFVEIGDDHFIQPGQDVLLEMQTNISPATIEWTGPAGQQWAGVASLTVRPTGNGTYHLLISDANGCPAEDELQIFVAGEGVVFVPTAFSPNGDNVNDVLTVFAGKDVAEVRSFTIFDRWGETVFEQKNFHPNDLSAGWDGRHRGKLLDPAVFVFMAEVEFLTGETGMFSGGVVLVR